MRQVAFVLLAALGIMGCAAQAQRNPAPNPTDAAAPTSASVGDLRGTDWRFIEVEGTAVPGGVIATLRLGDGRASGKAGCNAYGASWETSADGGIHFGQTMSTKMACLEPAGAMQVERGVFDALQHAARVLRADGKLVLLDASGQPLATLVPEGGT